jgi:hypothetical protein
VCDTPAGFAEDPPCWPSKAAIEACGGEFLKAGVRVVRLGGRVFAEGDAFENAAVEQRAVRRHRAAPLRGTPPRTTFLAALSARDPRNMRGVS